MTDYIERDIWKSLPDDLPYKASVKRVLIQAPAAVVVPWEWLEAYAHGKRTNYCSDFVSEAKDAYSEEENP